MYSILQCRWVFSDFLCNCCALTGCRTTSLFLSHQHAFNWVPVTARWWAVVERCATCPSQTTTTQWSESDPCSSAVADHHRSYPGELFFYDCTVLLLAPCGAIQLAVTSSWIIVVVNVHLFQFSITSCFVVTVVSTISKVHYGYLRSVIA